MLIRDATQPDFPVILDLNEASVQYLSPLDMPRLTMLHEMAAYHRVAEHDGRVVAFLLAFREGAAYDSVNYRWFGRQYPQFLYIDRVVVSADSRGSGVGRLLYEDVFRAAREMGVPFVTCEYDVEPPNEVSQRFHNAFGFTEVGSQMVAAGKKKVSLQAAEVK